MHPYVLIPLFAGVASAMIGSAILARDSSHRGSRLVVMILGCAAYWNLLEVVWNTQDDADTVLRLIRLSSLGWMPLGVLCVHVFHEVSGEARAPLRRALPLLHGALAISIALYLFTSLGLESAHPTGWGWSFEPGALFLPLALLPAGLAGLSLALLWRRLYRDSSTGIERRQALLALVALGVPLFTATLTDVFMPLFDVHVPRLGSASLALVGAVVAWSTRRYGYSLLAPHTFAPEILATLRDGVALLRQDGRIRSANSGLARLCGLPEEELPRRSIEEFLPHFAELTAEQGDEIREHECQLVPHPGAARRGATESAPAVPVSFSAALLRDRDGARVGKVLTVRDLREVVGLRTRLLVSGRLAAVGELAAGIAHEINNPLAFVQSNLNQLGEHWRTLDSGEALDKETVQEGQDLIDECLDGVSRVAATVQYVRGFADNEQGSEVTDLNALLDATLRIARPQLRYHATIELDYAQIPPVHFDGRELKQVLLNMLLNAYRAIDEGGTIRVGTRHEPEHGRVVVTIEDDGGGMPPELLERLFDPFFTTREMGEGMGVGLSLSYQLVRSHGGDIEVESEPGGGTRFRILLREAGAAHH